MALATDPLGGGDHAWLDLSGVESCSRLHGIALEQVASELRALTAARSALLDGTLEGSVGNRPERGEILWGRGRVLARVVDRRWLELGNCRSGWVFADDGTWFSPARSDRVSLGRRRSQVRLVAALLAARVERPGASIGRAELFDVGWPDQKISRKSMDNRLNVAVSSLRKVGLGILERTENGYRLSPSVGVISVDPSS